MEAHPTSYRDVVLRSKSEAVFIRAVELSGLTNWEYEPERFRVGDWVPDFWIVGSFFSKTFSKRVIMSALVEYKPSQITASYRKLLEQRFTAIEKGNSQNISLLLACGNAFDPTVARTVEEFYEGIWEESANANFILKHLDEAKTFRFDLQQ